MSEENVLENELTPDLDSTLGGIVPPEPGTAPPEEIVADPAELPAETPADETPTEEKELRGKDAPITQDRFDEIYGRMARAEREVQRLRKPRDPEKVPELKSRPIESDYGDYNEFVDALTDWKIDNREAGRIKERNESHQKRTQADAQAILEENIAIAEQSDPEFRDKGFIHPQMVPLVYDSERFSDLAYYFKQNPGEVQRILMQPTQAHAAKEIGKIEASLGRPKPRTETKAPSKTKPVGPGKPGGKKPEDMAEDEYMADRKKKLGYG